MQSAKRLVLTIALLTAAPVLSSCGFTPLYATADTGGKSALASVRVSAINAANDTATPVLARAFEARTAHESEDSKYDLFLNVKEEAQQLAVQIDDSVTRYNYRMIGAYTLVNRETGKKTNGRATAVVSFNVVSSQYSTLFAETAAREKAARVLVEEIDRDILINLAAANEAKAEVRAAKSE
ncbi:MAG: hypothetical protein R3C54_09610 [Parvularculaceae bacterium]